MRGDSEDAGWEVVSSAGGWRIVSRDGQQYTALYEGMHRMICKLAWRHARRSALDVEDLINEGYLAVLKAQDKYDPTRAARSTFVYWVVRNHLWQLVKRWPIHQELPDSLVTDPRPLLEDGHTFREIMHALSNESKDVIKLLFGCPKELCEMARNGTPERLQKTVSKMLTKRGWMEDQIVRVFHEISRSLNSHK